MKVLRRLIFLALLITSCLVELNVSEAEGRSSCNASLGGANLADTHKALVLQLNANENCTWTIEKPENKSIRLLFSHIQAARVLSVTGNSCSSHQGSSDLHPEHHFLAPMQMPLAGGIDPSHHWLRLSSFHHWPLGLSSADPGHRFA
ncbi:CUB and zona pellucida-like domain-containing protein 1 [Fukomys damarensis]|uniref:CUB and zona pellucida-like domain-containing protein 1 n=1 Tax=Fukomys damarensis TaxID=885580 RepID=A0A091EAF2_FUKDA|nr:CUB and zona pellucida-like domain-containing protein 1 [Fukomys damarensis]